MRHVQAEAQQGDHSEGFDDVADVHGIIFFAV
jgi:hypothetical protein